MTSENNLKAAFAGESQANRKYLAFAKKAEEEGFKGVAKLFRAAAEAETIHAMSHLKALGLVKSTSDNLKAAVAGETFEFTEMYPEFIAEAEKEGAKSALIAFKMANEAEKVHADLYTKALDNLETNGDTDYYVCEICGNIHPGSAPEKCSICGAPASKFKNVG
jgi:rubrerythrin